jgi:hypothetical protein
MSRALTEDDREFMFANARNPVYVMDGRAYVRGVDDFGFWGGARVAEEVEDGTYTDHVPLWTDGLDG